MRRFNFNEKNKHGDIMVSLSVKAGLLQLGEQAPYFTITGHYRNRFKGCDCGGCIHEIILEYMPELEDLVRFHVRHMDGTPLHTVENGWYFVENKMINALANHLLVSDEEAQKIIDDCQDDKNAFIAIVEANKDRWQDEANVLIKKYKLKIDKE
ncbi:hypothetical protein IJ556_03775 [bacterium]|nr:hypothetical protein [bacterium]